MHKGLTEYGPVFVTADWHVGDREFLYETLLSTFERTAKEVPSALLVVAGDLVTGRGVYRDQQLDALPVPLQVVCGVRLLQELTSLFREARWVLLLGNHDRSGSGWDLLHHLAAHAQTRGLSVEVVGESLLLRSNRTLYIHHGIGSSRTSPHPPRYINSTQLLYSTLLSRGVRIDRFVHGHTHWLNLGFRYGPFIVDSVGGFQAYVRARQRLHSPGLPGGALYIDGEAREILPDLRTLERELGSDLRLRTERLYARLVAEARRSKLFLGL